MNWIFYSIDGGEWKEYTGNFKLKNYDKGSHVISYYSMDALDNSEEIKSITVMKTDLSSTEIYHGVIIIIVVSLVIIVIVGLSIVLLKGKKKREEDREDLLIDDRQEKKKMIDKDISADRDPTVKFIISDLLKQYPEIIIAIYGIGSYFDESLPSNWVKNDLDIIVIVKSLEQIPKREWTEIRYKKKIVDGNNVWLGFNTIEAYQDKIAFRKESVSNYEWSLIDITNPDNSKLLWGTDVRDQLPNPDELTFDHDNVLARGLYHLDKSLSEKEALEAMKAFSKAIFKTGFYFCIFLDKIHRSTSILEIGNKLKQLCKGHDSLERMNKFFEEAIIFRVTGQFRTDFGELQNEFISYIFSSLEKGTLHRRMDNQDMNKFLTITFNGFPYLIKNVKEHETFKE